MLASPARLGTASRGCHDLTHRTLRREIPPCLGGGDVAAGRHHEGSVPHLTLHSPLGELTVFEEDGRIVALEWGRGAGAGAATGVLAAAKRQLDAYFDDGTTAFDLPLAPAGTAFQKRVWEAMRAIGPGETRRYGDLAAQLGSSARAVGTACGANPIPIIIPCHRVVGAASLGGYSGGEGPETKRFLLAHEQATH
jgi:methylated-DNA-[protein]-cysteine S-methyltransferase